MEALLKYTHRITPRPCSIFTAEDVALVEEEVSSTSFDPNDYSHLRLSQQSTDSVKEDDINFLKFPNPFNKEDACWDDGALAQDYNDLEQNLRDALLSAKDEDGLKKRKDCLEIVFGILFKNLFGERQIYVPYTAAYLPPTLIWICTGQLHYYLQLVHELSLLRIISGWIKHASRADTRNGDLVRVNLDYTFSKISQDAFIPWSEDVVPHGYFADSVYFQMAFFKKDEEIRD
jgi:hypothetical protein